MPPQQRPRAVLYLRLSDSDDASTSIVRQETDLRARAERDGWDVVEVLTDDGLSGRRTRAKAERALAMLRDGEADLLAVWKFDRWSRQGLSSVASLIDTIDAVPAAVFIADRDGLDSRQPAWRIIAAVLAEIARQEAENTQLRVTSSIARLRLREARFAGGTVPYGYRTAPLPKDDGRVLVVDPAEAAIVNEVADRILAGESRGRVARDLNLRGVPAPRSEYRRIARAGRDPEGASRGVWRTQSLETTLTGRHILGQVIHHGEPVRDEDGLPATVWPPVLKRPDGRPDADRWQQLRARLLPELTGKPRQQRRRRARLLSGILTCGECGGNLYVRHAGAADRIGYRCSRPSVGELCPGVSASAPTLEGYVVGEVMRRVGAWPVIETRVYVTEEGRGDLGEIEEAIRGTTAALAADDADVPALLARLEALKARRAEVRATPAKTTTLLVPTGQTYAEAYEAADTDEARRAVLEKVITGVRVRKGAPGRRTLDTDRVVIDFREDVSVEVAASSVLGEMLEGGAA